jgi:hypothetical protein
MSRAFSFGMPVAHPLRTHAGMPRTLRSRLGATGRNRCEADPENGSRRDTTDIRDRRDACPRNTRESPGTRQDAAFRKDAPEAGVVATEGDDAAEDGATRSGGRRKAAHHE